ncbi:SDR family oxidoreductase [Cucumibacter marinus]|uniref:SDR family oxidoreductase n=1 Tax=Cucumibacter marinus TaxID=1121252 RepID=UPI0004125548|nr:SDR family oxidoreductase [Cucumibacter marinus]
MSDEPTGIDLSARIALVTGSNRGIGRAIATALAAAGADIIGVSASMKADGGEVGEEIRAMGRSFAGMACDFSERADLYRLVSALEDRDIDILVNNAGIIRRAPAAEHGDEDWDHVIAVNLTAPFILSREIGKRMIERGSGKIIFIASVLSFQGGINVPGYAAAKGGIAQLTKALANEWAGKGVNVNAIAPGYIATDNTAELQADKERSAALLARVPAARWGVPADIGAMAAFLASDAAAFIHGTVLPVDGGWLGR